MIRFLLLPVLALAAGCSVPAPPALADIPSTPAHTEAGKVVFVSDGDTVKVDVGGLVVTARLIGIDSPEVHNPHLLDPQGHEIVQCGGPEASAFARDLLDGRHVTLVADPTQGDRDRYKRLLRYVRLDDGRDYSIEAARAGMARNYVYGRKRVQEQDQIEAAETDARTARRGLWGHCNG